MNAKKIPEIRFFIKGKPEYSLLLLNHFIQQFESIGTVKIEATKTMIGISNQHKRIAWVTQIGKKFIHVVFPFKKEYHNNLCFQKVVLVPGSLIQYNHHFRMLFKEDLNEEVLTFMKLAYKD